MEEKRPSNKEYVEKHEDEYLDNKQLAMTHARENAHKVAESFRTAGVNEKMIHQAIRHEEDAAQKEFEDREKNDPIQQIINIIQDNAKTEQDKKVAVRLVESLKQQQKNWQKLISRKAGLAKMQKKEVDLKKIVEDNQSSANGPDIEYIGDELRVKFWLTGILPEKFRAEDQKDLEMSDQYLNRLLKGLGALAEELSYHDLRELSSNPEKPDAPSFDASLATAFYLKTNVDGIIINLHLNLKLITFLMPFSTFSKSVQL